MTTYLENEMNQLVGLVSEYGLYGASLLAFVAIVVWIFRPSAKKRYQADGSIPFNENGEKQQDIVSSGVARSSEDKRPARLAGPPHIPHFLLDEGRQALCGNVGFRLLVADNQELLWATHSDEAIWC
jgi:hypothetical protein